MITCFNFRKRDFVKEKVFYCKLMMTEYPFTYNKRVPCFYVDSVEICHEICDSIQEGLILKEKLYHEKISCESFDYLIRHLDHIVKIEDCAFLPNFMYHSDKRRITIEGYFKYYRKFLVGVRESGVSRSKRNRRESINTSPLSYLTCKIS